MAEEESHKVVLELTVDGVTDENKEEVFPPMKEGLAGSIEGVEAGDIELSLQPANTRRLLSAATVQAEISTDSEDDANTLANEISGTISVDLLPPVTC